MYLIRFAGHAPHGDGGDFSETAGWTLSYSPEYHRLEPDPDLLLRLAALTSGEAASPEPARAFSHDIGVSRASRPAWPWLFTVAALLLPFDVAVRRLIPTRQDFLRLRNALRAEIARRKPPAAPLPAEARLDALRQAKERARAAESPKPSVVYSAEMRPPAEMPPPAPAVPSRPSPGEPPSGPRVPTREAAPPLGTAEALLKRKQARRRQNGGGHAKTQRFFSVLCVFATSRLCVKIVGCGRRPRYEI